MTYVEIQRQIAQALRKAAERDQDDHEHEWPDSLDHHSVCLVPGCGLTYGAWSEPA